MLVVESDFGEEVDDSLDEIPDLNSLLLAEIRGEFRLEEFDEEGRRKCGEYTLGFWSMPVVVPYEGASVIGQFNSIA